MEKLEARIAICEKCPLCKSRTKTVPGSGNIAAPDIMFIGEAPGAEEDQLGKPFVGAAGELLTRMIEAMGYMREEIFITNICKCRPPRNRTPRAEETQACLPYLQEQIRIIRPKVLVLLGNTAIHALLVTQKGVTGMQGRWTTYNGIPAMPTYHPAYIIRFESAANEAGLRKAKREVWSALKAVLTQLGRPVPAPKRKST